MLGLRWISRADADTLYRDAVRFGCVVAGPDRITIYIRGRLHGFFKPCHEGRLIGRRIVEGELFKQLFAFQAVETREGDR